MRAVLVRRVGCLMYPQFSRHSVLGQTKPLIVFTAETCPGCQIRRFQTSPNSQKFPNFFSLIRNVYEKSSKRVMSSGPDKPSVPPDPSENMKSVEKETTQRPMDTFVKVQATRKNKPKIDLSQSYYENIFINPMRAMSEYQLESADLDELPRTKKRSPYPEKEGITMYLRKDVERKAIEKWGSLEALQREIKKQELLESRHRKTIFQEKSAKKEYKRSHSGQTEEKPFIFNPSSPHGPAMGPDSIFKLGSGRVVLYAITINAANCLVKLWAWMYTGSHSMFSEFIHSLADTVNQVILAVGLHQSLKQPDTEHPYGWMSFRNISSLISGVGIFCLGSGLSIYHGIQGLIHPQEIHSMFWAMAVLMGSFVSEGATLMAAIHLVRQSAKQQKMRVMDYIWRGEDPSTNVVLLEDAAAVVGVVLALGCMGISHYTGNPMADAIGSLLIGSLLGGVASFIIYTNSITLVGRSIQVEKKAELMKELESDRMIRALHDVKATDMGGSFVRFKAEVDFDGKELTRYYLEQQDIEKMLEEVNKIVSIDELELFMLKHGESIVDTLGGEVDRIEKNLKKKHPEVRHVDLEQL